MFFQKTKMRFVAILMGVAMAVSAIGFVVLTSENPVHAADSVKQWNTEMIENTLQQSFASYPKNGNFTGGTGLLDSTEMAMSASSTGSDWLAFAIGRYGKNNGLGNVEYKYVDGDGNTQAAYKEALRKYFVGKYDNGGSLLHRAKATEWHRGALAYLSVGGDPTSIAYTDASKGTFDLIADGTYNCVIRNGPGARQGINGWIWGLLAVDYLDYEVPADAKYSREKLITEILKKQIYNKETGEYGGWSLYGSKADADITGMTLTAFAPYYNDETKYTFTNTTSKEERTITIRQAYEEGLSVLPSLMDEYAVARSWNALNSESTAWMLLPLISIGIDPLKDSRFITSKNYSLVDGLMSFALPEGGFCHTYEQGDDGFNNGGGSWNPMACDQANYTLVGYWRYLKGYRSLFDFRPDFTKEERKAIDDTMAQIDAALAKKGDADYGQALKDAFKAYEAVKEAGNGRYVYNYAKLSDELSNNFTVTFSDGVAMQTVEKGHRVILPETNPVKEATAQYTYTFDGWYNGDMKYDFETPVTSDIALKAKFTEKVNTYTVAFNNGETKEVVEYGATVAKPAEPKKADTDRYTYTFDGWYNGDEKFDFATAITGNMILNPRFTAAIREFKVTFSDGVAAQTVKHNEAINYVVPEKEGYTFDGWYNGDVKFDSRDLVQSDLQLTAKFTKIEVKPVDPEPEKPVTPEKPAPEPEKKDGCGSFVGAAALGMSATVIALAGMVLFVKKKEN